MKQLVTLFNFSNRIATEITRLFPNEKQSIGEIIHQSCLPSIPATAINIQAHAKIIRVCNGGPSLISSSQLLLL